MAHGDAAHRVLDYTGIDLVGRWLNLLVQADCVGLDLPPGHRRLRTDYLDSAQPDHASIAEKIPARNKTLTMSPQAALHSEIFRAYFLILTGVLVSSAFIF